jgi:lipid-binding SYLF domain-containing protein
VLAAGSTFAQSSDDKRRAELLANAQQTLEELLAKVDGSKALYDEAAGYAVFTATKAGFIVTGGGGSGVCIDKATGDAVYTKMGTGGAGLGFGAQRYDIVILFESADRLKTFVDGGLDGGLAAQATAGSDSSGATSGFLVGAAVYTLDERGLMAAADISGTRFRVNGDLN